MLNLHRVLFAISLVSYLIHYFRRFYKIMLSRNLLTFSINTSIVLYLISFSILAFLIFLRNQTVCIILGFLLVLVPLP